MCVFHIVFHLPPTSPTSLPSCDWVPGICWGANSRPFLMNQQRSRWDLEFPHHLLWGRLILLGFLAWLLELCLHSQCLLTAQASWFCQVCVTASSCKRSCKYMYYVTWGLFYCNAFSQRQYSQTIYLTSLSRCVIISCQIAIGPIDFNRVSCRPIESTF